MLGMNRKIEAAGLFLGATAVLSGCAGGPSAEDVVRSQSTYEAAMSNPQFLVFRSEVRCYSNQSPEKATQGGLAEVTIKDTRCFGDTGSFGLPKDSPAIPETTIFAQGATIITLPKN